MIETRRLKLRRPHPGDEPRLVALDSDADVMRYVGSPPGPRPYEETVERVRERIRDDHGQYGWWIIEGKDDRAFHGLGLLRPMPAGDEIEVGLRLCRGSWGLGIATEAASALIDYALRTIGLPHVVAVAYLDNRASRHVLEKLGFTSRGPCEYRGAHVERYVLGADAWRANT